MTSSDCIEGLKARMILQGQDKGSVHGEETSKVIQTTTLIF